MCSSTHEELVRVERNRPFYNTPATPAPIDDEVSFSEMDEASISQAAPPMASRSAPRSAMICSMVLLGLILINPLTIGACINTGFARKVAGSRLSQRSSPTVLVESDLERTRTIYSIARTDRSGSAIHEMLLYHAEAYARNTTYGGACVDRINWGVKQSTKRKYFTARHEQRIKLLEDMGLADQLPMACPSESDLASGKAILMNRDQVEGSRKQHFTEDWIAYLQSKRAKPSKDVSSSTHSTPSSSTPPPIQVAVHVRRGDVTPCRSHAKRYLPNQYYLDVLDKYLPQVCKYENPQACLVTVYTEEKSFETVDAFLRRGYRVDLDSSLSDIWLGIMTADVVVTSRSSFSQVPAMLNQKNKAVVIVPFDKDKEQFKQFEWATTPGLTFVDGNILSAAEAKLPVFVAFCE